MRLELSAVPSVFIDLRATGILRAVGHDPTLSATPTKAAFTLSDDGGPLEGPIDVAFRVDSIAVPLEMTASDREKMQGHLRGSDVLDAARFPTIDFHGRYAGSLDRGELSGNLVVRGVPRPIALPMKVARDGQAFVATGAWEGKLTDLGIKPFKALLGALRLEDWIRLRVEARLNHGS